MQFDGQLYVKKESRAVARKPRDTAAVPFGLKFFFFFGVWSNFNKFVDNSSQSSKARIQRCKHTGVKQNFTQNGDSRSFKVTCFGVSGKAARQYIITLALFVKVPAI